MQQPFKPYLIKKCKTITTTETEVKHVDKNYCNYPKTPWSWEGIQLVGDCGQDPPINQNFGKSIPH